MITSTSPQHKVSIAVEPDARDLWQAALLRFDEHQLQLVRWVKAFSDNYRLYDVSSFSQPGTWHEVEVLRCRDHVFTLCDCDAGVHGTVCQHAAGALRDSGWAPFELLAQPTLLASSDRTLPQPRFRSGQYVRLGQRKSACLVERRWIVGTTWWYALITPANENVGSYPEERLSLFTTTKRRVA